MSAIWIGLLIAVAGSYLLKLAGLSLPESVLNQPRVRRVAQFLPVAMLAVVFVVAITVTALLRLLTG
jgi:hypothetical protein